MPGPTFSQKAFQSHIPSAGVGFGLLRADSDQSLATAGCGVLAAPPDGGFESAPGLRGASVHKSPGKLSTHARLFDRCFRQSGEGAEEALKWLAGCGQLEAPGAAGNFALSWPSCDGGSRLRGQPCRPGRGLDPDPRGRLAAPPQDQRRPARRGAPGAWRALESCLLVCLFAWVPRSCESCGALTLFNVRPWFHSMHHLFSGAAGSTDCDFRRIRLVSKHPEAQPLCEPKVAVCQKRLKAAAS